MDGEIIGTIIGSIIGLIIIICIWASKSAKASNMKESYHDLRIGMTKDQVIGMLGEPNTVGMKNANTEILQWRNDEGIMSGAFDKDTTRVIQVEIQNGRVVAFNGSNIDKRTW